MMTELETINNLCLAEGTVCCLLCQSVSYIFSCIVVCVCECLWKSLSLCFVVDVIR